MKKSELSDKVNAADVDDVVGIALELMNEDDQQMSLDDVKAVAGELDIPPEYIEKAQAELRRRRERERVALQKEASEKRTLRNAVAGVAVVVAVVVAGGTLMKVSTLNALRADVERQAAQVKNVEERRVSVVEMYRDRPSSPDKDAELIGAENRVRVEKMRYLDAVAEYDESAGGVFGTLASGLTSLPSKIEPNDPQ